MALMTNENPNLKTALSHRSPRRLAPTALAGGGLLGGFAAFVGASCCVLPLVLFNLGVSSALIARLGVFARYQNTFLLGGLLLVLAGAGAAFWRGRRPPRRTLAMLGVAIFFISAAYIIPFFEFDLMVLLGLRGEG
jgi:mercuric ion transport protein